MTTVYIEIFTVDLILLFSRVHAPTVKLKPQKLFSNSHATSPITYDHHVAIHTEASNSSVERHTVATCIILHALIIVHVLFMYIV